MKQRRRPFAVVVPAVAVAAFALALPAAAQRARADESCANVCDQPYALCIAASCTPNADGATASCACVVEDGWSVGPTGCAERAPVTANGVTQLTSTFSAALYASDPFQQGSGPNTDCYGDPCTSTDGETATCTCKIDDPGGDGWWSEAGGCQTAPSGTLYSAAGSPFDGGPLAHLTALIAECSGTSAPQPQSCSSQ